MPPAGTLALPTSPEAIERGKYLAEHVAVCVDCHSERDFTRFAGPIKAGTMGKGGERFDGPTAGLPGVLYASNITPAGIGDYSDGELMRAVTTGVARDGRAMFPLMPYPNYGRIAREDVESILGYVRTLAPIEHRIPERSLDPPLNLIVRTIPRPAAFTTRPSPDDRVKYGEYLVTMASCAECHSPRDGGGQLVPGMDFAGGNQFAHPSSATAYGAPTSRQTRIPASVSGARSSSSTNSRASRQGTIACSPTRSSARTPRCRGRRTPA